MSVTPSQVCFITFKSNPPFTDPSTAKISLETTYDPSELDDYDPDAFSLDGAHVVQQAMYDENAELVTPKRTPAVFAPGALVAVQATLHIFHFLTGPRPNHVCSSPSYLHC